MFIILILCLSVGSVFRRPSMMRHRHQAPNQHFHRFQTLKDKMGTLFNHSNDPLNVMDFGAVPDGKTDCTEAFKKALEESSKKTNGNVVFVPSGEYLISQPLTIPSNTVLKGIFENPSAGRGGTLLLTTWGHGKETETPFLSLGENAGVNGLQIFYPNQQSSPPVPYPWTIRQIGDNIGIRNVLIINPWNAVDCGTVNGGRHFIKGLYAQPLHTGLYIDNCYDIGRVEDVHFWPFWSIPLMKYTSSHATAFKIGRTDWQYIENSFSIGYKVGWHFVNGTKGGPGNVLLTNSGADEPGISVIIEATEPHAGISFVNGQFMGGVQIKSTNTGPIKFTSCGFWAQGLPLDTHLKIEGGHVMLTNTHFIYWANTMPGSPAVHVRGEGSVVAINGCDFMDSGKVQVLVEEDATMTFTGNLCAGEINVQKKSTRVVESANIAYGKKM